MPPSRWTRFINTKVLHTHKNTKVHVKELYEAKYILKMQTSGMDRSALWTMLSISDMQQNPRPRDFEDSF